MRLALGQKSFCRSGRSCAEKFARHPLIKALRTQLFIINSRLEIGRCVHDALLKKHVKK